MILDCHVIEDMSVSTVKVPTEIPKHNPYKIYNYLGYIKITIV